MSLKANELPPGVAARLRMFCVWLVALTALSWGLTAYSMFGLNHPYPSNWPLLHPVVRFSDLTDYVYKVRHISDGAAALSRGLPVFVYPAPALFVYWFFIQLFSRPVVAYLIFSLTVWLTGFAWFSRQLRTGNVYSRTVMATLVLTCVCGYPFLFLIDRGNIEIVVVSFVVLGAVCFAKGLCWPAAVFFGLAGCIKPFPLLFLCLFLKRKLYREIGLSIGIVAITNLIAMYWLGPTVGEALAALKVGADSFLQGYVLKFQRDVTNPCSVCVGFDHSFFSIAKQAIALLVGWLSPAAAYDALAAAYKLNSLFAVALIMLCGYIFRRKPVINQIFAIVILMLTVSPVSHEYTLVSLYIPLGLLFVRLVHDGDFRHANIFLGCMAVLFSPLSFLLIGRHGFGGQVKALVLGVLLIAASKIDLRSSLFGELPARSRTFD